MPSLWGRSRIKLDRVLLPRKIAAALAEERRCRLPLETGGFLIGKRRGLHLEVTDYTEQGDNDLATPSTFERADQSHTDVAQRHWKKSSGLVGLVGDWHSHPRGDPTPSGTDRNAWKVLGRQSDGPYVGLILADETISITGFQIVRGSLKCESLQKIADEAEDFVYAMTRPS